MKPALRRWLLGMTLLMAWGGLAQAQDTGLSFLQLGTNASASGMGEAHVALSRDAFSTYWNPAGLATATKNSVGLSHRIWIADVRAYALAARFRMGQQGGLGLSVTASGSGDLELRQQPGPPDGRFSAQFLSVGLSYGRRLGPVQVGATAKLLSERIFDDSATGYAFDFGAQLGVFEDRLLFGAVVQNLGEISELAREATTLPRTFRAGAAIFPFRVIAEEDGTTVLDVSLATEVSYLIPSEKTQVHAGGTVEVVDLIRVRAGFITNDTLRDLTFGAGLNISPLQFDYAFLPFDEGFEGPGHVLTLLYSW